EGTIKVTVQLIGALPKDAIPSLSVDGTIELFRLPNVLKMQRPAFGQENSKVKLFRMEPDDINATAVTVELGQTSVTEVEIRGGLKAGDKVIVSDTSTLGDNTDRIRLNLFRSAAFRRKRLTEQAFSAWKRDYKRLRSFRLKADYK